MKIPTRLETKWKIKCHHEAIATLLLACAKKFWGGKITCTSTTLWCVLARLSQSRALSGSHCPCRTVISSHECVVQRTPKLVYAAYAVQLRPIQVGTAPILLGLCDVFKCISAPVSYDKHQTFFQFVCDSNRREMLFIPFPSHLTGWNRSFGGWLSGGMPFSTCSTRARHTWSVCWQWGNFQIQRLRGLPPDWVTPPQILLLNLDKVKQSAAAGRFVLGPPSPWQQPPWQRYLLNLTASRLHELRVGEFNSSRRVLTTAYFEHGYSAGERWARPPFISPGVGTVRVA